MGACADWWQEEVERIVEQYRLEEIARTDAIRELSRKGLDAYEAQNLLNEATA